MFPLNTFQDDFLEKKVLYHYTMSYIYTKGWIFTFLWKAKWAFKFISSNSLRLEGFLSRDCVLTWQLSLYKKWSFKLSIYSQLWRNSQETADLVRFTEEILNGKLHFLCCVKAQVPNIPKFTLSRSSPQRCSMKKVFLEIS